jgi:CHASE2 domain-containing sensor protein
MKKVNILAIGLLALLSCKKEETFVTIVDIGRNDRIKLGEQLKIIGKFSPRIVGLDFYLVPDSLDRDTIIVNGLKKLSNSVQVVGLYNFHETLNVWDSLKVSHSKFKVGNHGFSNLSAEDDSVIVRRLPLRQSFLDKEYYSFGYIVAKNSFGVKPKYRDIGDEELDFNLNNFEENYKLISSEDLILGKFRKEDLLGKIVLMGYIGEKEDFFYMDYKRNRKINGVEIHAAVIKELLDL